MSKLRYAFSAYLFTYYQQNIQGVQKVYERF